MSARVRHRYEGRADGPVQQVGEVVDRRRVGQYWALTITAGEVARRSEPGQFVNVAVEGSGTLLRRPFSLAGASASGPVAGTVDVLFDVHGPGTEILGRARTGDRVAVMGPLGRPFPLPQRRVSALLVAGGYGAAPMYWLGDRLRAAGHKVGFVLGAASQSRLVDPIVPKRMATFIQFTTDDGSMGTAGQVTDELARAVAVTGAEVVYACGPNPMLAAVSAFCDQRGLPCQVAVEEHMACGVGVCMTCVLPIRDRKGVVHNRRVCTDGAVFTSTRIAWEESRYAQQPMDEQPVLADRADAAGGTAAGSPAPADPTRSVRPAPASEPGISPDQVSEEWRRDDGSMGGIRVIRTGGPPAQSEPSSPPSPATDTSPSASGPTADARAQGSDGRASGSRRARMQAALSGLTDRGDDDTTQEDDQ